MKVSVGVVKGSWMILSTLYVMLTTVRACRGGGDGGGGGGRAGRGRLPGDLDLLLLQFRAELTVLLWPFFELGGSF